MMYVVYELANNQVLCITKSLKADGVYLIVESKYGQTRFNRNSFGSAIVQENDITDEKDVPLIYEDGKVIKDPFYVEVEEEVPDDSGNVDDGSDDEERPMTVAEMRTKIKELEEQLAATKILLGVE